MTLVAVLAPILSIALAWTLALALARRFARPMANDEAFCLSWLLSAVVGGGMCLGLFFLYVELLPADAIVGDVVVVHDETPLVLGLVATIALVILGTPLLLFLRRLRLFDAGKGWRVSTSVRIVATGTVCWWAAMLILDLQSRRFSRSGTLWEYMLWPPAAAIATYLAVMLIITVVLPARKLGGPDR